MIKTIDIRDFETGSVEQRTRIAEAWDEAFSCSGFCLIKGHGISRALSDSLLGQCAGWFSCATPEEKDAFSHGPKYGDPNGGYTKLGIEVVGASYEGVSHPTPDLIESFVFTSKKFQTNDGEYATPFSAAEEYYQAMSDLRNTLHHICCSALGVEESFFEQNIHNIEKGKEGSLKLSYYHEKEEEKEERVDEGKNLRYGAHTDFQDLTILRPDLGDWSVIKSDRKEDGEKDTDICKTTGGLQVLKRDTDPLQEDNWIPAVVNCNSDTIKGGPTKDDDELALLINIGDFWNVWSAGRWKSAVHRVTGAGYPINRGLAKDNARKIKDSPSYRLSLVFFSNVSPDALISPLPGALFLQRALGTDGDSAYRPDQLHPLTAEHAIRAKIAMINANGN